MKTFSRVLLVILFLATCGVAVYAIREGNSILLWLVTICIVGYAVWLAFDMIYSRLKILDSRVVQALEEMRQEYKYTDDDLVKFGRYLLSEQREQSIENKENLREVHDSDLTNWREIHE